MVQNDYSWGGYASCSSALRWSRAQNKLFELAIVFFPEGSPDRWTKIAHHVPGKTPLEVEAHYNDLVSDIEGIESGEIELPTYQDDDGVYECRMNPINKDDQSEADTKLKRPERRKGVPWTEEEHKKFLVGLEKYGKGDWRSISRYVVLTRTPSQVASHAQKYFIRLRTQSSTELILRPSIHDVTISKVDSTTTLGSDSAATVAAAYSAPSSDSISLDHNCWNVKPSSGICRNMLSYGGEQTKLILRPSIHDVTISKVDSTTTLGSDGAATAAAPYSAPSCDSISVDHNYWNVEPSSGICRNMLTYGGEQRWTNLMN